MGFYEWAFFHFSSFGISRIACQAVYKPPNRVFMISMFILILMLGFLSPSPTYHIFEEGTLISDSGIADELGFYYCRFNSQVQLRRLKEVIFCIFRSIIDERDIIISSTAIIRSEI